MCHANVSQSNLYRVKNQCKSFIIKLIQWLLLNRRPTVYETVALPLSYHETAHSQNGIGELPMRLLAGSNRKLVRQPGVAPGPSPSQGEMLLLHHEPDLQLMEMGPLVGLAPTNTGLRNPPCGC